MGQWLWGFAVLSSSVFGAGHEVVRRAATFKNEQSGATAMEFGLVVLPFLMMIFAVINSALYFFTVNSLDRGVEDAVRQVRTGEFRFGGTNGAALNVGQFRQLICDKAQAGGATIDCASLNILIKNNGATWAGLAVDSCQTAGNITSSTGNPNDGLGTYVGGQSTVVMVTACYYWDLPRYLPLLKIVNFNNGLLIQSSSSFRSEPY